MIDQKKFLAALELQQKAITLMKEAFSEADSKHEPLLNASQLARECKVSRHKIRALFKDKRIQTYDHGKRAKPSDVIEALRDTPVQAANSGFRHVNFREGRISRSKGPIRIEDVMKG